MTQIDIAAQAIILDILQPTLTRYDLGLLAEEGDQDTSRLTKHAFWTIDPLDGTQYFIEGQEGFTTSIALVSRDGRPILGVAYDPIHDHLYEAVVGGGVLLNGEPLPELQSRDYTRETIWFADRSLRRHPSFKDFEEQFDIRMMGVQSSILSSSSPHPTAATVRPQKKRSRLCYLGLGRRIFDAGGKRRVSPPVRWQSPSAQPSRERLLE